MYIFINIDLLCKFLNGTGPNLPRLYDVIVEPSQTTGQLPASYIVVHTFVTVRNGHLVYKFR
jgi:hypothetical protein